jgi:hypothetical protein
MRDLQDRKELDVRFKRSENNSADIMTKNTTKDIHDKHNKQIRHDSLPFWKEDIKQDSSMTEFTHSQMGTNTVLSIVALIAPIALAYYVSSERQRNRWNHQ